MEPTIAEVIFWIVLLVVALIAVAVLSHKYGNEVYIDIDEWERKHK